MFNIFVSMRVRKCSENVEILRGVRARDDCEALQKSLVRLCDWLVKLWKEFYSG